MQIFLYIKKVALNEEIAGTTPSFARNVYLSAMGQIDVRPTYVESLLHHTQYRSRFHCVMTGQFRVTMPA